MADVAAGVAVAAETAGTSDAPVLQETPVAETAGTSDSAVTAKITNTVDALDLPAVKPQRQHGPS